MSSHLYSRSNGQEKIYPCQVSKCPRARNNSNERKNVRWFYSKELMVKHMNRKHNICIKNEEKRLHNIDKSREDFRPICSTLDSQESLRRFPCLVKGCVRARNESREKFDIKWFASKQEMTRHLNKKHGTAIRSCSKSTSNISQNETVNKTSIQDTKSMHEVVKKEERCSSISSDHKISSFYQPILSPKCEPNVGTIIEFANDSLRKASGKAKTSPYLPPLSPNGPSSRIAFDHKMRNGRTPRARANLKEPLASTDESQKPLDKSILEGENNWIGKKHSVSAETKVSRNVNNRKTLFPGPTDDENYAIEFAYVCAFCNWQTTDKRILNHHIWEVHFVWVNGHKMINCQHCPQRLEKLWELAWHTKMWHLLDREYLENGYFVICLKCNAFFETEIDIEDFEIHKKGSICRQQCYENPILRTKDSITENVKDHFERNCTGGNVDSFMQFEKNDDECKDTNVATRAGSNNSENKKARFFASKNCPSSHESAAKSCTTKNPKSKHPKTFWEIHC